MATKVGLDDAMKGEHYGVVWRKNTAMLHSVSLLRRVCPTITGESIVGKKDAKALVDCIDDTPRDERTTEVHFRPIVQPQDTAPLPTPHRSRLRPHDHLLDRSEHAHTGPMLHVLLQLHLRHAEREGQGADAGAQHRTAQKVVQSAGEGRVSGGAKDIDSRQRSTSAGGASAPARGRRGTIRCPACCGERWH